MSHSDIDYDKYLIRKLRYEMRILMIAQRDMCRDWQEASLWYMKDVDTFVGIVFGDNANLKFWGIPLNQQLRKCKRLFNKFQLLLKATPDNQKQKPHIETRDRIEEGGSYCEIICRIIHNQVRWLKILRNEWPQLIKEIKSKPEDEQLKKLKILCKVPYRYDSSWEAKRVYSALQVELLIVEADLYGRNAIPKGRRSIEFAEFFYPVWKKDAAEHMKRNETKVSTREPSNVGMTKDSARTSQAEGFFSAQELCNVFTIPLENNQAFIAALGRLRKKLTKSNFKTVETPPRGSAKYLYRANSPQVIELANHHSRHR